MNRFQALPGSRHQVRQPSHRAGHFIGSSKRGMGEGSDQRLVRKIREADSCCIARVPQWAETVRIVIGRMLKCGFEARHVMMCCATYMTKNLMARLVGAYATATLRESHKAPSRAYFYLPNNEAVTSQYSRTSKNLLPQSLCSLHPNASCYSKYQLWAAFHFGLGLCSRQRKRKPKLFHQ